MQQTSPEQTFCQPGIFMSGQYLLQCTGKTSFIVSYGVTISSFLVFYKKNLCHCDICAVI